MALAGIVVASLIGSAAATQAQATSTQASKKRHSFTIGELTILTGRFVAGVVSHRNAMTMAIEDLQKTKRFTITRVTEDCGSTPASAVTGFQAIKTKNPIAIVGCPLSPQTQAIGALASESKILHMAPNALMAKDLGKYKFNVFSPYTEYQVKPATTQFLSKFKKSLKTAYYVAGKDYAVGQATVAARKAIFERAGILTVGTDEVLSTDTNYTALAVKIASINPSVLVEDSLSSLAFLKAVRDAGYKGMIFGGAYVGNANFLTVQTGQFENAYSFTPWLALPLSKLSKAGRDFATRYKKKFGTYPDAFAAGIYDGIVLLAEAIAKAGGVKKGPDAISRTMARLSLRTGVTSTKTLRFDGFRVLPMNPVLIQVKNQAFQPVK